MDFRNNLIKYTATLSIFITGLSATNGAVVNAADNDAVDTNVPIVTAPVQNNTNIKTDSVKEQKLNKIVKLVEKQVGKRYIFGATGPSAFDCSGLVQYVYNHAGHKHLPRTTYTQVHTGKKVSMKHLKKGDLLFWGAATAPYHVGIYVGKGQYVHAATPEQGVRKQTLSSYFYPSVAKRVL